MYIPYYVSIIALTLVVPNTVFGECKVTDLGGRYIVVCSGKEPSETVSSGVSKRKAGKPEKASFKSRSGIAMSEEERLIMETHNRLDGYRLKRKARVKTSAADKPVNGFRRDI